MPEGPEVAITADTLADLMTGATVSEAVIVSGRYFTRDPPPGWEDLLESLPLQVKSVHSQGKFMYLRLRGGGRSLWIWNTYGMSGRWCISETVSAKTRVALRTDRGWMCYLDTRNFGTFQVSRDRAALQAKIQTLSPDLLRDQYQTLPIRQSKRILVRLLMDQQSCGSGIGNYLVAEILYRARLSPHRPGRSLSETELQTLVETIQRVIKLAYARNRTGYMRGLSGCLGEITRREYQPQVVLEDGERFRFAVYRRETDPRGREVVGERIIPGRTTWWCPEVQV